MCLFKKCPPSTKILITILLKKLNNVWVVIFLCLSSKTTIRGKGHLERKKTHNPNLKQLKDLKIFHSKWKTKNKQYIKEMLRIENSVSKKHK